MTIPEYMLVPGWIHQALAFCSRLCTSHENQWIQAESGPVRRLQAVVEERSSARTDPVEAGQRKREGE